MSRSEPTDTSQRHGAVLWANCAARAGITRPRSPTAPACLRSNYRAYESGHRKLHADDVELFARAFGLSVDEMARKLGLERPRSASSDGDDDDFRGAADQRPRADEL